jgi:hypothetical protein
MISVILFTVWMTIIILKRVHAAGWPNRSPSDVALQIGGNHDLDGTAHPPAGLTIEVYTAPGRPFASAATPEGPGDLPTWSPSSATLIHGGHDAILVDTLIT